AGGAPNAALNREALRRLDWLVMRDWFEIESACYWRKGPERPDPKTIKTEIFFMPAAAAAEKNGCFTNTQRLIHTNATRERHCPTDGRAASPTSRTPKRFSRRSTATRSPIINRSAAFRI